MRSAISAVAPCLLAYPTRINHLSVSSCTSVAPVDRGITVSKVPRDGDGPLTGVRVNRRGGRA